MTWKVWLKDGTTRESQTCAWADVPDGILFVVRWDDQGQLWRNWGDGVYGDPATWKAAGYLSDADWARFEAEVIQPV